MTTQPQDVEDLFGPPISSYSRAQAIEDGVLVDVSALAREAGIRFPVAVTAGVFAVLAPWAFAAGRVDIAPDDEVLHVTGATFGDLEKPQPGQPLYGAGQDATGRTWDMLTILKLEIRRGQGGERVDFAPLFVRESRRCSAKTGRADPYVTEPVEMYAMCGPGDDAAPVITVLLPSED